MGLCPGLEVYRACSLMGVMLLLLVLRRALRLRSLPAQPLSVTVSTTLKSALSGHIPQAVNASLTMILSDLESVVLRRVPRGARTWVLDTRWGLWGSGVEKVQGVLRERQMDLWVVEGAFRFFFLSFLNPNRELIVTIFVQPYPT